MIENPTPPTHDRLYMLRTRIAQKVITKVRFEAVSVRGGGEQRAEAETTRWPESGPTSLT